MSVNLFKSIVHASEGRLMPSWTPGFVRRAASAIVKRSHKRTHEMSMKASISRPAGNLEDIVGFLEGNTVALDVPCVLISQAQRSGGSLLNQLFDGHPALAVYPMELRFGFVDQEKWPTVDSAWNAERNFRALFDLKLARQVRRGYVKGGWQFFSTEKGEFVDRKVQGRRFFYAPFVHYSLFERLQTGVKSGSDRAVLSAFFAGFFNSWLDYQGRLAEKLKITAFAPRFAHDQTNVSAFFACYPDGRLIQIIRDPRTWYPSSRNHRRTILRGDERDELLAMWRESAQSILRNSERFGDRVIVVTFEQLVGDTERTMRALCASLGIAFEPVLLEPTFNGSPMKANSSFGAESGGIIEAPLARAAGLSDDESELIERECVPLYAAVSKHALQVGGSDRAISPAGRYA